MAGRLQEEVQSNWSRVVKKGQAQRILYSKGTHITYNASGHIRQVDDQRGSRRIEYINCETPASCLSK